MKKFWITGLILIYAGPSYATSSFMCYSAPLCAITSSPDSTCDNICLAASCPSGQPTLPTGYTGTFRRTVITSCNSNGTYSCSCGVGMGSVSCASGYMGTAKYQYINGQDNFTGCYKCPSNATCSGNTITCNAGYYKTGNTCVRCAYQDGVFGTSPAGSTDDTACYVPPNTNLTDTSGTYIFTNNCYYSGGLTPLPLNPSL